MTSFTRYLSAIADAHNEIDQHSDAFARLMGERLDADPAAFGGEDQASLLGAATGVIARQAAADFVAMNRFRSMPAEAPIMIEATPRESE